MTGLKWVLVPLIGGLIGLVTNGIAIRMLFRPFREVKIGSFVLPFTPGLIPKEKARIAKAIGRTIGTDLLDPETLKKELASDTVRGMFSEKAEELYKKLENEKRSCREILEEKEMLPAVNGYEQKAKEKISEYITGKLIENDLAGTILNEGLAQIMEKMNPMVAMMARSAILQSQDSLHAGIEEIIRERIPQLLQDYIQKEYEGLLDHPLQDGAQLIADRKYEFSDRIWELYEKGISAYASDFLNGLDLGGIVEKRILAFDEQDLERLILEICRKELGALVWIGGLLGFLIGFVNLLFL